MQFWFWFLLFPFFLIIQSQAAFVSCLYVARFTIVHSKTHIKFPTCKEREERLKKKLDIRFCTFKHYLFQHFSEAKTLKEHFTVKFSRKITFFVRREWKWMPFLNCLDSKIPRKKSLFFNLNDSSLGRHVNAASRKSLEIQAYSIT